MLTVRYQSFGTYLVAVVLGLITMLTDAAADRAIPEDNLAYPVLITLNGITVSGFYLADKNAWYLVTAKHVLFDADKKKLRDGPLTAISYSQDRTDSKRNILVLDLWVLNAAGNIKVHPSEDVAVVKIGITQQLKAEAPQLPKVEVLPQPNTPPSAAESPKIVTYVPGITVLETTAKGLLGADASKTIKTFDQVVVGNEVVMFGYPTSLALVPNPKIDFARPLLRKGIVAGENPAQHSIILDCPSYQGDSGGPILEVERSVLQTNYRIIGVMTSFVPFADTWRNEHFNYENTTWQNSGYSVAVPIDFVLELTKD